MNGKRDRTGTGAAAWAAACGLILCLAAHPARAEGPVACDGLIEPGRELVLSTSVAGRIDRIAVDRGDPVKAGQVVIQLDTRVEKAAVDLQKARAEARSDLRTAKEVLTVRSAELERSERLFHEGILNDEQIVEIRSNQRIAMLGVDQAEERLEQADLELRQAQAILDRRKVVCPVSGVVLERNRHPGEAVQALEPVLTVVRLDPLHVEIYCAREHFGLVRKGQEGWVTLQSPHDGRYTANVTVVDPIVDAASGTFGVRLELRNPGGVIPAGVQCRVEFGE